MDPLGIGLLVWLLSRKKARPISLRFKVANDAGATWVLKLLEKHGQVLKMSGFDGKKLSVTWRPKSKASPKTVSRAVSKKKGASIVSSKKA